MGRQLLFQHKLDAVAGRHVDTSQKRPLAIAQLILLPRLRAQHAPQMVRRLALHHRLQAIKLFHKKSASHVSALVCRASQAWVKLQAHARP